MSRKIYSVLILLLISACRPVEPTPMPNVTVIAVPTVVRSTQTETAAVEATGTETAVPTSTDAPTLTATPDIIKYDVPILNQEGLTLNGAATGVGCAPVCIEMMTAYWNQQDDKYPRLSAQELIDVNAAQGHYVAGRGMSSIRAEDELAAAGYQHFMHLNSNKEELIEALGTGGPVGLQVKTNWIPTTMNHIVVLTGYDPQLDRVTINDPYYGTEITWGWDEFDGIWGLNYAAEDNSGRIINRIFFSIYPAN